MAYFQGYWASEFKFTLITTANGKGWLTYVYNLSTGESIPSGWSQPTQEAALEYAAEIIEKSARLRVEQDDGRWSHEEFLKAWEMSRLHDFTHQNTWVGNEEFSELEEAKADLESAEKRTTDIVSLLGEYARCTDPVRKKKIRVQLRERGHYLSKSK